MATLVQISGMPGTGKTFGVKSLDPATTYFIDADMKGLPWTGWRKDYSNDRKNYASLSETSKIYQLIKQLVEKRPEVNAIVIDTISSIMSDKEVDEMRKPGFDKWKDMAIEIYELYELLRQVGSPELVIFVMAHIEPYNVDDTTRWRTKTNGKALTKLNLSSKLNYNLYTHVEHRGEGNNEYFLLTQTDGKTEARSAAGVLPYKMSNDLEQVRTLIVQSES